MARVSGSFLKYFGTPAPEPTVACLLSLTTPNTTVPDCIWTGGFSKRRSLPWTFCLPTAQNSIPLSGYGSLPDDCVSTTVTSGSWRPSSTPSRLNSPTGPSQTTLSAVYAQLLKTLCLVRHQTPATQAWEL